MLYKAASKVSIGAVLSQMQVDEEIVKKKLVNFRQTSDELLDRNETAAGCKVHRSFPQILIWIEISQKDWTCCTILASTTEKSKATGR